MNVLARHMTGDTSDAHRIACLARHVAHWNLNRREAWLRQQWTPNNGQASCSALRIAINGARQQLIEVRDEKVEAKRVAMLPPADRTHGRTAIAQLRLVLA